MGAVYEALFSTISEVSLQTAISPLILPSRPRRRIASLLPPAVRLSRRITSVLSKLHAFAIFPAVAHC